MRLTTMILAALALAACGGCDDTTKAANKPERISVEWFEDGTPRLTFRFDRASDYSGLVDEKFFDFTETHDRTGRLVEYFHVGSNEWVVDHHWFPASHHPGLIIEGRLYGADVHGANRDGNGFAVLPGNADGSFLSDVDPAYPFTLTPEFYAAHPIAGQITRDDRANAIHYRWESRVDGVLVTWDGVEHWFPK